MSAKGSDSVGKFFNRFTVRAKLLAPVGIRLSEKETLALAEIYEDDARVIYKNLGEIKSAIYATDKLDISDTIGEATLMKGRAMSAYKQTKDPIKKREWARRLVIADQTLKSVGAMRKRMESTKDRLTMIAGDMQLQLMEAEAKAAEAESYAKAGKQLRLVGQKLVDARTRAKHVKMEYNNLEVTMEGAEKAIDMRDPLDILKQADSIAAGLK